MKENSVKGSVNIPKFAVILQCVDKVRELLVINVQYQAIIVRKNTVVSVTII